MSHLTEGQRSQMERPDMGAADRLSRATPGQQRAFSFLTPIFIVVLGVLVYAAVWTIHGWSDWIVIADIVVVFFGLAAWVWPQRKNI
jgi:protein-S-isoprenylcysteine O-methyltransferase Ste14